MEKKNTHDFAFGKENYILLIAGIVILAIGYLLMIGGGSEDPNVFSEEIFSTRRLTISPIVIMVGFITVLVAVMKKSKE